MSLTALIYGSQTGLFMRQRGFVYSKDIACVASGGSPRKGFIYEQGTKKELYYVCRLA